MSTPANRYHRTPVRAIVPEKTPGQLAAEKSNAQAEAAILADQAGQSLDGAENLVVVEHNLTIIEPSANPWQVLSRERLRAADHATLRAVAGMRGYGTNRGHKGIAKLSRADLIELILAGQVGDSRLFDPNTSAQS